MTTPNYRSPTFAEQESDTGAKEQAKQTAGTVADEGKNVAEVAKNEAKQVTSEAKYQARNLVGEAKTQVEDQSRSQRDRLVNALRSFSDELEQMSSQGNGGMASDLARQGAEKVRGLTDNLAGREPSELLEEVRNFARRRPGTFLLGALAAGIVAGRLARGARDASSGSTAASALDDQRGVSSGPYAATDRPISPPVPGTASGARTSGVLPEDMHEQGMDHSRGNRPDPYGDTLPGTADQPWTDDPARRGTT